MDKMIQTETQEYCYGCGRKFFSSELEEGLCDQCQRQEKRERNSRLTTRNKRDYRYE